MLLLKLPVCYKYYFHFQIQIQQNILQEIIELDNYNQPISIDWVNDFHMEMDRMRANHQAMFRCQRELLRGNILRPKTQRHLVREVRSLRKGYLEKLSNISEEIKNLKGNF